MINSGIYCIYCISNDKYYIGQAIDIEKRIKAHINKLKSNSHHSPYLQNTFNLYKLNNFQFNVLEYCNIDELDVKEQFYILKYNSLNPNGFNCTIGGNGMRGFKFSKETKENWSKSRKGKYMNDKHPKSIKIKGIHQITGNVVEFDSLSEAERFLGIKGANKNISTNCRNKKKSAYKYVWTYNNLSKI